MDDKLADALRLNRGVPVRLLAEAAGVTPQTIYQRIKRKELRVIRPGKKAVRDCPDAARQLLGLDEKAA
jgi:AcrR family transcriptional regulator